MKLLTGLVTGLLILALGSAPAAAEVSDALMAEIFNGLADIIERNMGNPENCIAQLQAFIQENKAAFMEWKYTAEKNIEKARANPQQMPSQEDMQRIQEEMEKSQGVQAMNRWAEAISNFAMTNPGYMDRVTQAMEEISPRPDDY